MKVIKIGAVWCASCLVMRPRWKQIEEENPWLETTYYDFDTDKEKVAQYAVQGGTLPVCIFMNRKGKEIKRMHGEIPKKELTEMLMKYKNS